MNGIPSLVILSPDGELVNANARESVRPVVFTEHCKNSAHLLLMAPPPDTVLGAR